MLEMYFDPWGPKDCCRFRIYEQIQRNGALTWSHRVNLGERRRDYSLPFPKVIKPIEKEKFILFTNSANHIELWEKNRSWIRSTLSLPTDFEANITDLWLLQM